MNSVAGTPSDTRGRRHICISEVREDVGILSKRAGADGWSLLSGVRPFLGIGVIKQIVLPISGITYASDVLRQRYR